MSEELKPQDAPVVDAAPAPTEAPAPTPAPAAPAPAPQVQVKATPTPATSTPATPTPAAPKPAPVVTPTQPAPAPATSFDNIVADLKAKGSIAEKSLIQSLESYIAAMKPGMPVAEHDGAQHQYTLWRTMHSLIHQSSPEEFPKQWNLLLAFFFNNQNEGQVFHDRYVFRFSEYWNRHEDELNAYQRLLNLVKLTSNPNTRKQNLKQVSLDRTLSVGFTEDGRQKLLSFYA
jgi:hypothetical protein